MLEAVGKVHITEQFLGAGKRFGALFTTDKRRHCHIFKRGKLREQLVELKHKTDITVAESCKFLIFKGKHIGAVEQHAAAIRLVERADNLQQSGLTCTTWPHNRHNFAIADSHAHPLEHLKVAISLNNILNFNHLLKKLTSKPQHSPPSAGKSPPKRAAESQSPPFQNTGKPQSKERRKAKGSSPSKKPNVAESQKRQRPKGLNLQSYQNLSTFPRFPPKNLPPHVYTLMGRNWKIIFGIKLWGSETKNPGAGLLPGFAVRTGLEPATSCVTGRHSNQLN